MYLELEIQESATREEVRAAYWQRAKQIHPDKNSGEKNPQSADKSMSRLNEIMAVLGDDTRRAKYDAELKRQREVVEADIRTVSVTTLHAWEMSERSARIRSRRRAQLWFAGLACLVVAGGFVILPGDWRDTQAWQKYFSGGPPFQQAAATEGHESAATVTRPGSDSNEPAIATVRPKTNLPLVSVRDGDLQHRNSVQSAVGPSSRNSAENMAENMVENIQNHLVRPQVQDARRALERKAERPLETIASSPRPVIIPAPREAALVIPVPQVKQDEDVPPKPHARTEPWNGDWEYLETLGGSFGGAFTPITIEMHLHASGQRVLGIYKARYKVTHKYLDTVEFSIEGRNNTHESLKGVWQDPAGAKGEFELKKVDREVVEMNWWTTAFGRKRALASGLARLIEVNR